MIAAKWEAEHKIRDTAGLSNGARMLGLYITSCMTRDGDIPWQYRQRLTRRGMIARGFAKRSLSRWLAELERLGVLVRESFLQLADGQCRRYIRVRLSDLLKGQNGPPTPHKKRPKDRTSVKTVGTFRSVGVSDSSVARANQTLQAFGKGNLYRSRSQIPDLQPSAVPLRDLCARCGKPGHPREACPW
jgi:hypothetical protein